PVQDSLLAAGFQRRKGEDNAERYLVDLGLDETLQRKSLSQKWRYNLKRSEQSGLDISVVSGSEAFQRFSTLYASMLQRKAIDDNTWFDQLSDVSRVLPDDQVPQIVLATRQGRDVAGAVVGGVGQTAQYLFGASNLEGTESKAGYLLQWHVTRLLSQSGYRWYDLGGEAGSDGLRQFKKGLVGKSGKIVSLPGEYVYCIDVVSRAISETAFAARAIASRLRRLPTPSRN
ncbi:MAG: peptidoglycan bridge formation glycyltransferase FemA/FemB family protein, partial [Pseudomonadota bacterium]